MAEKIPETQKRIITPAEIPTRLLNVPLLVAPGQVEAILAALNRGKFPEKDGQYFSGRDAEGERPEDHPEIAVISILGGMTYRGGWWRATYSGIRHIFQAAVENETIKAIVFDIDSPGGEAAGLFDLMKTIREARSIKPIYAIANDDALSGAYGIVSAAGEVYVSQTSMAGSIGVIAVFVDQSKFDNEKMGVKYTAIYAGEHKADFNPHEPLKPGAREWLQESVDKTWEMFIKEVSAGRKGLKPGRIREMQAAIYEGQEIVNNKLADRVLPWHEAMAEIIGAIEAERGRSYFMGLEFKDVKAWLKSFVTENPKEGKALLSEIAPVEIPAPGTGANQAATTPGQQAGPVDIEKIRADVKAELEVAEKVRITGITDLCKLAGCIDKATGFIQESKSVEDVRKQLLDARAAESEKNQITSATDPLNIGGANPLLADAKQRADTAKAMRK